MITVFRKVTLGGTGFTFHRGPVTLHGVGIIEIDGEKITSAALIIDDSRQPALVIRLGVSLDKIPPAIRAQLPPFLEIGGVIYRSSDCQNINP